MPDRSRCPACGERVSPFAAGCATCGADLDTGRWDKGPGVTQQAGSWLAAITRGGLPVWAIWALVIAAVVIGGTSLMGGRGSYLGTLAGAVVLIEINTLLIGLGLQPSLVQAALGAIIILLVSLYGREPHLRNTI